MNNKILPMFIVGSLFTVMACSESTDVTGGNSMNAVNVQQKMGMSRWYSEQQTMKGGITFQKYCAECHQPDASGASNWRQKDEKGKYPPPPLNGTAHAWHHPLDSLRRTVQMGGVPLGGSMPGFADKLNAQEVDEVLAWVQSTWSDEIYAAWHERNKQASR